MEQEKLKNQTRRQINNFLSHWHRNFIDVWWRRKYKIPFGSKQHREMNFIDMLIEFQEEIEINKQIYSNNVKAEIDEDYGNLTQEEIDEDYENLDLDNFKE